MELENLFRNFLEAEADCFRFGKPTIYGNLFRFPYTVFIEENPLVLDNVDEMHALLRELHARFEAMGMEDVRVDMGAFELSDKDRFQSSATWHVRFGSGSWSKVMSARYFGQVSKDSLVLEMGRYSDFGIPQMPAWQPIDERKLDKPAKKSATDASDE